MVCEEFMISPVSFSKYSIKPSRCAKEIFPLLSLLIIFAVKVESVSIMVYVFLGTLLCVSYSFFSNISCVMG